MSLSLIIPLLFAAVYPVCLVWAAVSDVLTMTIPNRLVITLALGFIPCAFLLGLPPMDWAWHVGIGVAALVVGMGLFAVNALGGGDAKMMAAILLWLGKGAILPFLVYTAFAGGIFALILIVSRKYLTPVAAVGPQWLSRLLTPKEQIPYGVAIYAGGLLAIPYSNLFTHLSAMAGA